MSTKIAFIAFDSLNVPRITLDALEYGSYYRTRERTCFPQHLQFSRVKILLRKVIRVALISGRAFITNRQIVGASIR